MRADNSAHLAVAAQQRRLACIERVHAVLDALERDGGAVTVAGVADKRPTTGRPALPDQ